MNKVMISKEEAAALESALEVCGGDKASVVKWHANELWDGERSVLNEIGLDEVCTALFVGYEIEADPEEEIFNQYMNGSVVFQSGIKFALDKLGIQIKGIND